MQKFFKNNWKTLFFIFSLDPHHFFKTNHATQAVADLPQEELQLPIVLVINSRYSATSLVPLYKDDGGAIHARQRKWRMSGYDELVLRVTVKDFEQFPYSPRMKKALRLIDQHDLWVISCD